MSNSNIKKLIRRVLLEEFEYRGEHEAPHASDGYSSPIYDMTNAFGEDIYSNKAARYFGTSSPYDQQAVNVIQSLKGRPNAEVTIYRSIPKIISQSERIEELEAQKRYILKTGKLPKGIDNWENSSKYYDFISDEIDRLKSIPEKEEKKGISINDGDWVTTIKQYAIDHGKSHLNGKYRILSKKVKAKNVYGNGDSIFEFGYSA